MKPTYISTTERLEQLRKDVCIYYGISLKQFTSKLRKSRYVRARQLFHYVARHHIPNVTVEELAAMTNRDHTTVIHGIHKIRGQLKVQPELVQQEIADLASYVKPEEPSPALGLHLSICYAAKQVIPNDFDHKQWIWEKAINGKM